MTWNRREYAQIENSREYRDVAGPLGLPWIGSFAFVGPLGLAGLLLGLRGAKRASPDPDAISARAVRFAGWYLVVVTLTLAPFFVTDRYRHHLLPALLLLTAVALAWIADALRTGRGWAALALAVMPGVVLVNLPMPYLSAAKYAWGEATDLGMRWAEQGRWDLAVREYERAIALEKGGQLTRVPGASAASERADLYYDYGNALAHVGRDADAVAAYERAVAEAPDRAPAVRALADAYAHQGRTATAESLYTELAAKVGGEGLAAAGRAWMAARGGRFDTAEQLFAEAVRLDPRIMDAWGGLIRLQAQRGAWSDAHATLERAREAGLADPALAAYEALLAASDGRHDAAERDLARVPAAAIEHDQTLADVVRVTRSMLGP
jgi:tetratricopeptide (TPR) repeat protein